MRFTWVWLVLGGCWHSTTPAAPPQTGGTQGTAVLEGRLQIQPAGMCGGARPPDSYRPPPLAPAPNHKILVTAGTKYQGGAPTLELMTAQDGTFSGKLAPGTYCITRGDRGAKPTQAGRNFDLDCLVNRWELCTAVVEVPVKKPVLIDIHEPCSWSVCYHGAPPP